MIECSECGCTDFSLDWAGPHIKAICKACGNRYKAEKGGSTYMFISTTESKDNLSELATDKQIKYVKVLMNQHANKMPKALACDIIATFKKISN